MSNAPRNWEEWKTKYWNLVQSQRAAGSPVSYEWEFVGKVLRHVSGLPASRVVPQHEFVGENGEILHMDFGFEVNGNMIAIEVEGFDKTGSSMGKTMKEHNNWASRQRALEKAGWKVIAITNKDFLTNPIKYQRIIEDAMTTQPQSSHTTQQSSPNPQPVVVKVQYETSPPPKVEPSSETSAAGGQKSRSTGSIVVTTALVIAAIAGIYVIATNTQASAPPQFNNPLNPDCQEFQSRSQLDSWAIANPEIVSGAFLDGDGDGRICESFQYPDD